MPESFRKVFLTRPPYAPYELDDDGSRWYAPLSSPRVARPGSPTRPPPSMRPRPVSAGKPRFSTRHTCAYPFDIRSVSEYGNPQPTIGSPVGHDERSTNGR